MQLTNDFERVIPGSRAIRASLSEYWFAASVGLWLCWLPIVLRMHSLPVLLELLKPVHEKSQKKNSIEMQRAVEIVMRVCRMWLFQWPIFPKLCLRQSLALYYVLNRMGYQVEIHFGIHKQRESLRGHSWVTVGGKQLEETNRTERLKAVYSYGSRLTARP